MANFVQPPKTLRLGVDEALYSGPGGAVNTTGAMGTFAIPPQCSNYRGQLVITAAPVGGTITAATFQLEVAMQPQGLAASPSSILNRPFGVTGAAATLTAYSGLLLVVATVGKAVALDLSGLGGNGLLLLNFTTLTLGTGTGLDIYAHIG